MKAVFVKKRISVLNSDKRQNGVLIVKQYSSVYRGVPGDFNYRNQI